MAENPPPDVITPDVADEQATSGNPDSTPCHVVDNHIRHSREVMKKMLGNILQNAING